MAPKAGPAVGRHPTAKVKGGWSPEEDALLARLVKKFGEGNWSPIARALNEATGKTEATGRIGKQCRERWNHHLSPGLRKDPWTAEEERQVVEAHRRLGNRWSDIARCIPGRSENAVKNHWNATLRKRVTPENPAGPLKEYLDSLNLAVAPRKRNAGRSRKRSRSHPREEEEDDDSTEAEPDTPDSATTTSSVSLGRGGRADAEWQPRSSVAAAHDAVPASSAGVHNHTGAAGPSTSQGRTSSSVALGVAGAGSAQHALAPVHYHWRQPEHEQQQQQLAGGSHAAQQSEAPPVHMSWGDAGALRATSTGTGTAGHAVCPRPRRAAAEASKQRLRNMVEAERSMEEDGGRDGEESSGGEGHDDHPAHEAHDEGASTAAAKRARHELAAVPCAEEESGYGGESAHLPHGATQAAHPSALAQPASHFARTSSAAPNACLMSQPSTTGSTMLPAPAAPPAPLAQQAPRAQPAGWAFPHSWSSNNIYAMVKADEAPSLRRVQSYGQVHPHSHSAADRPADTEPGPSGLAPFLLDEPHATAAPPAATAATGAPVPQAQASAGAACAAPGAQPAAEAGTARAAGVPGGQARAAAAGVKEEEEESCLFISPASDFGPPTRGMRHVASGSALFNYCEPEAEQPPPPQAVQQWAPEAGGADGSTQQQQQQHHQQQQKEQGRAPATSDASGHMGPGGQSPPTRPPSPPMLQPTARAWQPGAADNHVAPWQQQQHAVAAAFHDGRATPKLDGGLNLPARAWTPPNLFDEPDLDFGCPDSPLIGAVVAASGAPGADADPCAAVKVEEQPELSLGGSGAATAPAGSAGAAAGAAEYSGPDVKPAAPTAVEFAPAAPGANVVAAAAAGLSYTDSGVSSVGSPTAHCDGATGGPRHFYGQEPYGYADANCTSRHAGNAEAPAGCAAGLGSALATGGAAGAGAAGGSMDDLSSIKRQSSFSGFSPAKGLTSASGPSYWLTSGGSGASAAADGSANSSANSSGGGLPMPPALPHPPMAAPQHQHQQHQHQQHALAAPWSLPPLRPPMPGEHAALGQASLPQYHVVHWAGAPPPMLLGIAQHGQQPFFLRAGPPPSAVLLQAPPPPGPGGAPPLAAPGAVSTGGASGGDPGGAAALAAPSGYHGYLYYQPATLLDASGMYGSSLPYGLMQGGPGGHTVQLMQPLAHLPPLPQPQSQPQQAPGAAGGQQALSVSPFSAAAAPSHPFPTPSTPPAAGGSTGAAAMEATAAP